MLLIDDSHIVNYTDTNIVADILGATILMV